MPFYYPASGGGGDAPGEGLVASDGTQLLAVEQLTGLVFPDADFSALYTSFVFNTILASSTLYPDGASQLWRATGNASPVTITLPDPGDMPDGAFFILENQCDETSALNAILTIDDWSVAGQSTWPGDLRMLVASRAFYKTFLLRGGRLVVTPADGLVMAQAPTRAAVFDFEAWGGGGAGGNGIVVASGTACSGGAGGGGGARRAISIPSTSVYGFLDPFYLTAGAGGVVGTGSGADSGAGGDTTVDSSFLAPLLTAYGGGGGGGGNSAGVSGGGGGGGLFGAGGNGSLSAGSAGAGFGVAGVSGSSAALTNATAGGGGAGCASGGAGRDSGIAAQAGAGGAGGGGVSATPTAQTGGAATNPRTGAALAGGSVPGGNGAATPTWVGTPQSAGGAGGGGSAVGNGGNGSAGQTPGGGGGGGGSALTPNTHGSGGAGGDGQIIATYR